MRTLTILCLLTLVFALGFAVASQDSGYVLIGWGKTTVEMSLVLAIFMVVTMVWLVARLVSLELWLRRARPRAGKVISRKKAADNPTQAATTTKNWTPRAR